MEITVQKKKTYMSHYKIQVFFKGRKKTREFYTTKKLDTLSVEKLNSCIKELEPNHKYYLVIPIAREGL